MKTENIRGIYSNHDWVKLKPELEEKAGRELKDFKCAFAEALLLDNTNKFSLENGVFMLYMRVARLIESTSVGEVINSQVVEKVVSSVEDQKIKKTVEQGIAFIQKVTSDISATPIFIRDLLCASTHDIAKNPLKI